MARVNFVKKARKDIFQNGEVVIKKGESYYYWALGFRGRKQVSKTRPDRRQLTQSEYKLRIYDLEDELARITASSPEDLKSEVGSVVSSINEYKEELESNLDSVPDQLRDLHVNNERIEALDNAVSELEGINFDDFDYDEDAEDSEEEQLDSWMEDKLSEIRGVSLE